MAASHADNPIDIQEFMIMPVGAPTPSPRRCASAPRSSTRCKKAAQGRRPQHQCRRRGRVRARTSPSADEALGFVMQAIEAAGYRPGEEVVLALDPAASEFYRGRALRLEGEGKLARCRRHGRVLRRSRAAATRSSRSRTAWPRTTGTAGGADRELGAKLQLVGDDIFVTNPSAWRRASSARHRQRDAGQGQPDRHA